MPYTATPPCTARSGVPVELISHDDVTTMWPTAYFDDFAAFAYEPRDGHGDAYLTGMAYAAAPRRQGVDIQQQTRVGICIAASNLH